MPDPRADSVHSEVLAANARDAGSVDRGDLALPPERRFAILARKDARLDPARHAGLAEGDAQDARRIPPTTA
ncbi:MAG TPA: hypothetical protein VGN94_14785 [Methylobacterium sp.]|nr:hypothetical protein [Methylobacterium sp.]